MGPSSGNFISPDVVESLVPSGGIFLLYEKDCDGMSIDADAGIRVN
jgi:hypothetical protein